MRDPSLYFVNSIWLSSHFRSGTYNHTLPKILMFVALQIEFVIWNSFIMFWPRMIERLQKKKCLIDITLKQPIHQMHNLQTDMSKPKYRSVIIYDILYIILNILYRITAILWLKIFLGYHPKHCHDVIRIAIPWRIDHITTIASIRLWRSSLDHVITITIWTSSLRDVHQS